MLSRGQLNTLLFFSMLYVTLPLCSEILLHKPVSIGTTVTSAGALVTPLWFVLSDIVTELYGYKAVKILFYVMFMVTFCFSFLTTFLLRLPSPSNWTGGAGYELVVGELLRQLSSGLIGLLIGGYINNRLIIKWKILLNGRYFWLRSIAASTIGETVFTSMAFLMILYHTSYQGMLVSLIFWGIVLKVIGNIIFSFPANLIVLFLRKTNYTNIFPSSSSAEMNPFAHYNKHKTSSPPYD